HLNPRISALLDKNDNIVSTDTELVKILTKEWESYYLESPNKINLNYFDSSSWTPQNFENIPNNINWSSLYSSVTFEELKTTINSLHTNSSPGLSQISYKHMKDWPDNLLKYITNCFNSIINNPTQQIPSILKHSKLVLLYKNGHPLNSLNYRPIALQETILKL